jgi:hypothetical protein
MKELEVILRRLDLLEARVLAAIEGGRQQLDVLTQELKPRLEALQMDLYWKREKQP